jgi:hypothetical protein
MRSSARSDDAAVRAAIAARLRQDDAQADGRRRQRGRLEHAELYGRVHDALVISALAAT